ncbi:NACHT domain-containing protein [Streptomyces sp. NPDC096339]|uniref:NACHT domain-containing protein n=1 Tax=Streptomyces sp. NPDC096339 TaxID=3366086 RepID=UPI00381271E3
MLRRVLDGLKTDPSVKYPYWGRLEQDRFKEIARQLMLISRIHTDNVTGYGEYLRLLELSETAHRDASVVSQEGLKIGGHVALEDLYVRRSLEQSILEIAMSRTSVSAQLVTGEPGCGKTSLLWSLHRQLAEADGVEPLFVRASYLIDGLTRPADPSAVTADALESAVACSLQLKHRPVVLIDTLDLLVAHPQGVAAVQKVLAAMDERDVPVVLTCRPEEAVELQFPPQPDEDGAESDAAAAEAVAFRRPQLVLGLYSDDERTQAVRRHAAVFCPDSQNGAGAATRLAQDILDAVYQGLPVKEVCSNPLYLRLLFDLYTPNPPLQQIDAGGLFDQVRVKRVLCDDRAGGREHDERSDWNLTAISHALARYMLSANSIEYRPREAADALERLLPGVSRRGIDAELAELRRRGLLVDAPAGGLRFFHQTFFEFMAAEYLRTAGRGAELVARMILHPQDLVLAAVAGQLIPRADAGTGGALLRPLLEHEVLADHALEWYADMRDPSADDLVSARDALRQASTHALKRFTERLPGHKHSSARRWVDDLTIVWGRSEQQPALRRTLFATVGRLASQHPDEAVRFCTRQGDHEAAPPDTQQPRLAWWVDQGPQFLKAHKLDWLSLFAALFPHDARQALSWLDHLSRALAEARAYGIVADAVAQVERSVDRSPARRQAHLRLLALPTFEALLDNRPAKVRGDISDLEQSVGRLWAGAQPETEDAAAERLTDALEKSDRGSGRARLHGAGLLTAAFTEERAQQAVAQLLDVRSAGVQAVLLTHVLVPVLLGRATAFRDALAATCRSELARLPRPGKEPDGSRNRARWLAEAVDKAIEQDLAPDRLLALLPSEAEPSVWLARDGLTGLLGPAAAVGHASALAAVKTWAVSTATAREAAGWPAEGVRKSLRAHLTDEVLASLVTEALDQGQWGELITVIEAADAAGLTPPAPAAPRLKKLTRTLAVSQLKDLPQPLTASRQIQLWRALIQHWAWTPPTPDEVAKALGADDSTYTSLLLLVEDAAQHPTWEWRNLGDLVKQLQKDIAARPERKAGASSPHRALATLLVRRHPLPATEARTVVDTMLDLTLPAGDALGTIDVSYARLATDLLGRLASCNPDEAAHGLAEAGRRLGSWRNSINEHFAKIIPPILGTVLAHLDKGGRQELVLELAHAEPATGLAAVTAFSMLAGTSAQPPSWYRDLGSDTTLSPRVRSAVTSHLHRYARVRCGGPWPELLRTGPETRHSSPGRCR